MIITNQSDAVEENGGNDHRDLTLICAQGLWMTKIRN